jgi:hypothetical protein
MVSKFFSAIDLAVVIDEVLYSFQMTNKSVAQIISSQSVSVLSVLSMIISKEGKIEPENMNTEFDIFSG